MTSADEYAQFARAHLPESYAEKYIGLLRPAVQFPNVPAPGEGPALRLGGDPCMPDDVEWPVFERYGPLSFIAELDCAAVAAVGGVDLMPKTGHLLFFLVDWRYEGLGRKWEHPRHLTEWTQGRVIYVPEGADRRARQPPRWLEPYGTCWHPARAVSTPPSAGRELAERHFGAEARAFIEERCDEGSFWSDDRPEYPLWAEDFERGIDELRETYAQCGGHSYSLQDDAEVDAARCAIKDGRSGLPDVLDEAAHWRVLLQTAEAEDLGMSWGTPRWPTG